MPNENDFSVNNPVYHLTLLSTLLVYVQSLDCHIKYAPYLPYQKKS